jgi:hypothetical protein
MKESASLHYLIQWFDEYVAGFYTGVEEFDYNITLKHVHTHRVLNGATELTRRLGIDGDLRVRAETAALLHDCGRFEQFSRYRSFRDDVTVDHGKLGVGIIDRLDLLEGYDPEARRDILFAVEHHNEKKLPEPPSPAALEITRMVRDADRMDIFRVITEELENHDAMRKNTVFWDLGPEREISGPVYEAILLRLPVDRGDMRSRSDFLCMVLSWTYLMNFSESLKIAAEAGHLSRLLEHLPDTERGRRIRAEIESM